MNKVTMYSVSDGTNKLINVIAAFENVGEMLVETIGEKYVDCDRIMGEYYEAAEKTKAFLYQLLNHSIYESMSKIGSTQV